MTLDEINRFPRWFPEKIKKGGSGLKALVQGMPCLLNEVGFKNLFVFQDLSRFRAIETTGSDGFDACKTDHILRRAAISKYPPSSSKKSTLYLSSSGSSPRTSAASRFALSRVSPFAASRLFAFSTVVM